MRIFVALLVTCALLFGCSADGLIWMPPLDGADALFRIVVDGRAGFIDASGEVVIPPTLRVGPNWGQAFYDGMLSLGVSVGPFLNTRGQKVLNNGFDRIWDFSEGLAAALETSGSQWGYIDHSGKFLIPPQFPFFPDGLVTSFSDGLAAIEISGKLGYIDHSGAFVIPRQFVAGTSFEEGIARVVVEGPCTYSYLDHFDPCIRMERIMAPRTGTVSPHTPAPGCRWKFIDKTGKPIVNAQFDGALGFHEGLAAVKLGDFWGFINRQGDFVISPSYRLVHSFSDGLALVANDTETGFIDKTGKLRFKAEYFKTEPFSEGLTKFGDPETGYIYVDTQGKQAILGRFVLASRFFHGLAHVKLDGKSLKSSGGTFAYIDKKGNRVFTYVM